MMRAVGLACIVALGSASLAAQGVMVAPHAVFIDHSQRSGSVLLYNPGTEAVEVTISTIFGYPTTDSSGGIKLYTPENPDSTLPRSEEHTSELQSRPHIVCRLLLENTKI